MSNMYAGLDVSLEQTSVCVINAEGILLKEGLTKSRNDGVVSSLLS